MRAGLALDAKNHILLPLAATRRTVVILNADDGKIITTAADRAQAMRTGPVLIPT